MGRAGNNREGLSEENKIYLLNSITQAYKLNKIIITDGTVVDTEHNVSIDLYTGQWLESTAGQNKANRRAYLNLNCSGKNIMCPDYTYICVIRALINNDTNTLDKLRAGFIVNHMNGDVQDNRAQNHEIIDDTDNKLHAALLHCIKLYFADYVWEYKYKNGRKEMTQNILNNRDANVSVAYIKEFNEFIENNKTCKVYRMTQINTLKSRDGEYKELPNKETIKYLVCFLRKRYNIDITPGLNLVDVVDRLQKEKAQDNYWKAQMA